ncbi:hypothetical protein B0T14DRAFT_571501 [Immersiella caudata]|uniref:Uncharacterized protein n=1 Tax=Immersiella caudata TaxID=314043 RepID=A0AA39T1S3_9PEZI|nr:hypothetical protein B0T14DRAFT_571501 [Immersiella caudata]
MARPRYPEPQAIWRLVPHGLSALACVILIALCSCAANIGFGYGKALAGRFFAGFWALGIDIAQIAGLADAKRRVPRLPTLYLAILELFTAGLVIVLAMFTFALNGYLEGCNVNVPITDCDHVDERLRANRITGISFVFVIPIAILHFISSILAWVDFAASRREK